MVLTDASVCALRYKLDSLGYHWPFSADSGVLIEKIVTDLLQYQESVDSYRNCAANIFEKYESLKSHIGPIVELAASLVRENNILQIKLIEMRESSESDLRDLHNKIERLSAECTDKDFELKTSMSKISELQSELWAKGQKMSQGISKVCKKGNESNKKYCTHRYYGKSTKERKSSPTFGKSQANEKSIKDLMKKNCKLIHSLEECRRQVSSRDLEIARLGRKLEDHILSFQKHFHSGCEKSDAKPPATKSCDVGHNLSILESKLEDSRLQQHEAELIAVHLAERVGINSQIAHHLCNGVNLCQKELHIIQDKLSIITSKITMSEETTSKVKKTNEELILEKDIITKVLSDLTIDMAYMKSQIMRLCPCSEKSNSNRMYSGVKKESINPIRDDNKRTVAIQCNIGSSKNEIKTWGSGDESNNSPKCVRKQECVYQKMKAERNYYHNEYMKISDHLRCVLNERDHTDNSIYHLEQINHDLESKLRRCEREKNNLMGKHQALFDENQLLKVLSESNKKSLENVETITSSKKFDLHFLLEESERTIRLINESKSILEVELANAVDRIKCLEKEKYKADNKIKSLELELEKKTSILHQLDQERDNIVALLDVKTECCAALENKLEKNEKKSNELNFNFEKLLQNLESVKKSEVRAHQKIIELNKEVQCLQHQNASLNSSKNILSRDKQQLQESLLSTKNTLKEISCDLKKSRMEVENLKKKLQNYVAEVQQVEEILQMKENDRLNLLENFRSLTIEASTLENNNYSLENEQKKMKDVLRNSEEKIQSLEKIISRKDNIEEIMEQKISDLSEKVTMLEKKLLAATGDVKRRNYD